ncbi:hypothetical protein CS022_12100 [Veronia nyctiphanis]|uniref:DUF1145 domain-containing protein n=1 Tax=Veronia nyctiphanis TaxID=1278244 RepID=A0A4V1LSV6_9GAMM|nr:DUF1145 domain-containing protein [Veronia nyctiphanis]RXJ73028.1 hypothetical protein CS022_12100 [Veronia nyctiphanis]
MKALLLIAKLALGFVWFVLFANVFYPFPGNAAITLYILAAFLFMMHGLQMLMFIGAYGEKINASRWEKFSILAFGVFAMLDLRRKYMQ